MGFNSEFKGLMPNAWSYTYATSYFFNFALLLNIHNFSNSVIICHDSFILSCIVSIPLMNEEGRTEPIVGLSDTLLRISSISVYFS